MSNMITKKGFRVTAAGIVALAVVAAGATSAEAKGRQVIRSGGCDNSSATWKLKAQSDDGRIEVEFEVDSNRGGPDLGGPDGRRRPPVLHRHQDHRRRQRLVHRHTAGSPTAPAPTRSVPGPRGAPRPAPE